MQHEFPLSQGRTNALQGFVMVTDAAIQQGIKEVVTVFAGLLGLINGLVDLAYQLFRIDFSRLRQSVATELLPSYSPLIIVWTDGVTMR